ncbi:MAG: PEP-CTERM sorting domain-containing protein [Bryobacteraceae bacterium]
MRHLLTLTLVLGSLPGFAATIQFEQSGWPDGTGPLHVSFTGQDSDGDGALLLSELTDFSATWKTPAGTDTAWRLPDIEPEGFLFEDVGNYLFFTRNPEYSLVSSAFEGEALASVFDEFLFPVASSTSPASAVPEPGTGLLLMVGIGAVLAGRRWRRSG